MQTDRGEVTRAAGRGRARLAAGAGRQRLPAAGRAALARARGASVGIERRARDLDRPRDRPGRLRVELPRRRTRCASASARSIPRFHVKEPTVDLAERLDRDAGPLPGQLDPAPAAGRGRGRRVLRRRLRRALPAADRRGNPDRASTSASPSGGSCAGSSEGAATRETALRRYGAFSARHTWQFECDAARPAARAPRPAARCWRSRCGRWRASASRDWAFDHYLKIAHPSFADGARRRRFRAAAGQALAA